MARSKIKISKIQKRDGRIVDFDPERITNVIYKSTEGVGEPNFDLAKELTKKVVENLEKKLPSKKIPTVEEVQDAVEKVLIEAGQARVAKAFILYRQKRAEIRKEKQQILNKTKIDEVDKRFDINALRVLRSRYLKKDEAGKVLESPKQLFERVATHAILPSLFYDKKVSQKRGKQHPEEKFKPEKWGGKIKIGDFTLNQFHLEALKRLYDRFNKNRKTKIKFSELLKLLKKGKFDKYQKEIRDYYNLMAERKFMPNTPALANFGKYLGMGSACFALDIDDSIESIMDTLRKATIIFKSGGGVGYNFSKLRPEGDFVKSSGGRASGPISFMTLFDQMTEVIRQGGIRRGANMGILDINHPDIEKFIVAKRGNVALRNFNISVFIKSDFWDYYRKKKLYPLINPRNKEIVKNVDPVTLFDLIVYQGWESAEPGVVFGENINKYNPLLKSLGPIRTTNPCVVGNTLVAVADGRNYVPIKQLAKEKKDVPVYCYGNGKVQIRIGRNPRKTREKVPVWKVTLDDRSHIIATEDHKFRNRNNNEIKLKDLRPGTILMPFYKFQYSATGKRSNYWGITQNNGERARAEYRMIAEFYLGRKIKKYPKEIVHHTNTNGLDNRIENLKIMNQGEHDSFHQTGERNVMKGKWWRKLSKEEKEVYRRKMSQAVSGEKNGMFGKRHKRETKELLSKTRKRYFQNSKNRKLLSQRIAQLYKEHPEIKEKISRAKTKYQFINSNCLNCDKTIKYKPYEKRIFCSHSCTASFINRIRNTENVKRTKAKRREDLRRALYRLGIRFTEEKNRFPKYKEFRELAKKRGYSGDVRSTFGGFTNFKEELLLHNHKVVSIEFYGYEDVYNITVDDFHTVAYITNPNTKTKFTKKPLLSGIITSQCGELPLYGNESCNLGSINVWAFVREKQSNSRKREVGFDWKDFERTIKITTRFLDNVIDVNHYPLPEIEEMTLNTRKMGLGIMGLGDLLYDLEIPYNSNEGLDFMERLMEFLNYHSKITSIELAKERGKFPLYDKSFYPERKLPCRGTEERRLWRTGRLDWQKIKEEIKKYGLRNAHTTTNAPTGSISMIAGCSSGIEPVFSLVYEKRITVGSFYYVNPVFERVMMREGLFDEDLIKDISRLNGSCQNINYIPPKFKKIFVTALDLKGEDHIRALAAFQKWTDASISKTINFPAEATIEEMRKGYLLAHKLGCKDLTVFRYKSIPGVLEAGARKEEKKPKKEEKLISLRDVKAKGPSIYREAGVHEVEGPIGQEFEEREKKNSEFCPKCKSPLISVEGCKQCPNCGWSLCAIA